MATLQLLCLGTHKHAAQPVHLHTIRRADPWLK